MLNLDCRKFKELERGIFDGISNFNDDFSKFMADSIAKQAVKVPVKIERNRNN